MGKIQWSERVVYFMLGILAVLGMLFLTGASLNSPVGRYQISS